MEMISNVTKSHGAQPRPEAEVMPDNEDNRGMEDFCLELEDSCSSSDNDMSIIDRILLLHTSPLKKAKRDVTEVLLACRGRGRSRIRLEEEEDFLPHRQVKVMAGFHHQGGVEGGQEEVLAGQWEVEEGEVEAT